MGNREREHENEEDRRKREQPSYVLPLARRRRMHSGAAQTCSRCGRPSYRPKGEPLSSGGRRRGRKRKE